MFYLEKLLTNWLQSYLENQKELHQKRAMLKFLKHHPSQATEEQKAQMRQRILVLSETEEEQKQRTIFQGP